MSSLGHEKASARWPWVATSAALVGCAIPAAGQVFLTEAQALQVIFGQDAAARREVKSLTDSERKKLEATSGLRFSEASYAFLVVEKQGKAAGYAAVLDEIGKTEPITFMVGMTPEGSVIDVAVMVFRESRGWEIKEKRFLRQFRGKRVGDPIQIDRDILNYSGATLSSKALTRGVKRALFLLQQFYPSAEHRPGGDAGGWIRPELPPAADWTDGTGGDLHLYRQARYRMGTICEMRLWAVSPASAREAFSAGFDEIARLDRVFSNYRDDSELARVNSAASCAPVRVSQEFWDLTRYAVHWSERSRGTFDVTVGPLAKAWGFRKGTPRIPAPSELAAARARVGTENLELIPSGRGIHFRKQGMELDFGGLAKGYAAERAARLARRAGAVSVLVNLGGSTLHAAGGDARAVRDQEEQLADQRKHASRLAPGEWPVLIGSPAPSARTARYLILPSGWTLSSSASSEQSFRTPDGRTLSHILDPRTGFPMEGVCSACVLTRSGLKGEVLTKPLLLLNASARDDFWRRHAGFRWALIQRIYDGSTHTWEPTANGTFLVPVS